jgi:hypothetical protein
LEISTRVKSCDVVLVCLSRLSVEQAGDLHRLTTFAVEEAAKHPNGFIFLIPVRFDDVPLPSVLQNLGGADLFEEHGYERLVSTLREMLPLRELQKQS